MKIIRECLFLVPYIAMWFFAVLFYSFLNYEGLRIDYGIVYGVAVKILYILVVLSVFLSFAIIKVLFIKTSDLLRYAVAFLLSIVLFIATVNIDNYTAENITFSKKMWEEHPQTRIFLYDKIQTDYYIYEYSRQEVIDLLGEPDEIVDDMFVYEDGNGNAAYVEFKDNSVQSFYVIT